MTERPTNTIPDKQHHTVSTAHAHMHDKEHKHEHNKAEDKKEKVEEKTEHKETKKEEKKQITKKDEAIAYSSGVHMSMKQGTHISRFIKFKTIDKAIADLEQVILLRKIVPFSGEIPHRKGKGMMSGRYPVDASKIFIGTLKSLKGNCIANGLDLDNAKIYFASVNFASRPMRRGGRKSKRANILVKAKEMKESKKESKETKETKKHG